jgi:hypothetical protein
MSTVGCSRAKPDKVARRPEGRRMLPSFWNALGGVAASHWDIPSQCDVTPGTIAQMALGRK